MKLPRVAYILCFLASHFLGAQTPEINQLISKAHEHRTNLDSCEFYTSQANIISRELQLIDGEARAKAYSGMARYNDGEADTAITLLYDALPALDEYPFDKGMTLWYIGKAQVKTRNFDGGEKKYLGAIEAFESVDSLESVADVYSSLGVIQGMQGNYAEALSWFNQAYELKIDLGLEMVTDVELSNIALVYMRLGNFEKAIELGWKAINLRDDDNDAGPYLNLGGTYNIMGQPDSALYFYGIGYAIAQKEKAIESEANALSNISNVYYQKGEHTRSIEHIMKALKIRGDNNPNNFALYTELGKNYRKLGQLDSAAHYLQKGLALSQKFKNKNWSKESSTFLGYLFADLEKHDSAFHYLTIALAYKDSLNNDRIQQMFSNERVRLETLDGENEIEHLKKERELKSSRNQTIAVAVAGAALIIFLTFLNYRSRLLLKQRALVQEKDILTDKLQEQKAQLSAHTLSMIHRKNGLEEIESQLENLEGSGKQKVKNIINVNKALEKDWDNFQTYFSQVHGSFFDQLKKDHPDLTQNEVRLTALIKMDLANKEIASLLNIEAKSVKMARYRLKKKLSLSEDETLNVYLQKFL